MFHTAEVTYFNKGFIENMRFLVKGVNVTASVQRHVCVVWKNCGNHVGGAMDEQSRFFLAEDALMNSSLIFVCMSVCDLGSTVAHFRLTSQV